MSSPAPTPLMIEGRQFPLDFAGGEFTLHGAHIYVSETPNSGLGTGLTVWDGSVILAKYLEARYPSLAGQRVLELGSGPGLAGLAAAALGASVTLSDLAYCLPSLAAAAARNAHLVAGGAAAPVVGELDWAAPAASALPGLQAMDLVLGADVVWVDELIAPLVGTLAWLSAGPAPPPLILIAHQTRSTRGDELLHSELAAAGFEVAAAPRDAQHPGFMSERINILVIRKAATAAAAAARDL